MRFLFVVILLAGTGLGIVYPWAATNFAGRAIGTYRAYDRGGSFRPVEVALASADAPVRVLVDLTTFAPPLVKPAHATLNISVSTRGETVLTQALKFYDNTPPERSPQLPDPVLRDVAGLIGDVRAGTYRFAIQQTDVTNIQIRSVDLILRSGGWDVDERARQAGFPLMAIGFVGLVMSLRGRHPKNPNSQPPAPRRGRGADRS